MVENVKNGTQGGSVVRTQALFREVNERVSDLGLSNGAGELREFLCECGSEACTEPIALSSEEYEAVRRIPTHFLVKPGHVVPELERVVVREDRYSVVEKVGEHAGAAVRLDPRRRRVEVETTGARY